MFHPDQSLVVHTWVCYFHVILNMKEVGDIELVQIGGVLQQKRTPRRVNPGLWANSCHR